MMRYRGGGIGHTDTRHFDEYLLRDGVSDGQDNQEQEHEVEILDEQTNACDGVSDNESNPSDISEESGPDEDDDGDQCGYGDL